MTALEDVKAAIAISSEARRIAFDDAIDILREMQRDWPDRAPMDCIEGGTAALDEAIRRLRDRRNA